MPILTKDFANDVFDILVNIAGAPEIYRNDFIHCETTKDHWEDGCSEYRFQGHLGYGGKYWSDGNYVSCYTEDLTDELDKIVKKTNIALYELQLKYGKSNCYIKEK